MNIIMKSAMDLMASAGLAHPDEVDRTVVSTRIERSKIQTFEETYPELKKGALLEGATVPNEFYNFWKRAHSESF